VVIVIVIVTASDVYTHVQNSHLISASIHARSSRYSRRESERKIPGDVIIAF